MEQLKFRLYTDTMNITIEIQFPEISLNEKKKKIPGSFLSRRHCVWAIDIDVRMSKQFTTLFYRNRIGPLTYISSYLEWFLCKVLSHFLPTSASRSKLPQSESMCPKIVLNVKKIMSINSPSTSLIRFTKKNIYIYIIHK